MFEVGLERGTMPVADLQRNTAHDNVNQCVCAGRFKLAGSHAQHCQFARLGLNAQPVGCITQALRRQLQWQRGGFVQLHLRGRQRRNCALFANLAYATGELQHRVGNPDGFLPRPGPHPRGLINSGDELCRKIVRGLSEVNRHGCVRGVKSPGCVREAFGQLTLGLDMREDRVGSQVDQRLILHVALPSYPAWSNLGKGIE